MLAERCLNLRRDRSDPESMSSGFFSRAPPPPWIGEGHLLPEEVGHEVLGTPTSQATASAGACDFFFEPRDELTPVLDDACVCSDPDLKDATLPPGVEAEQDEADQVSIAMQSDEATACMSFLVTVVRQKSDGVGVESRSAPDEEDQFAEFFSWCRCESRSDSEGVHGRGVLSDAFLGQVVAAISGN
jgi:hypothetical protein